MPLIEHYAHCSCRSEIRRGFQGGKHFFDGRNPGESLALAKCGVCAGAGAHQVHFDAGNLASAAYFYRLQSGTYVETRKRLLIR